MPPALSSSSSSTLLLLFSFSILVEENMWTFLCYNNNIRKHYQELEQTLTWIYRNCFVSFRFFVIVSFCKIVWTKIVSLSCCSVKIYEKMQILDFFRPYSTLGNTAGGMLLLTRARISSLWNEWGYRLFRIDQDPYWLQIFVYFHFRPSAYYHY